jgi:voltage-gated potassium channel
MPGQRLVAWWVVLRLAVLLTAVSSLVVVAGGSALWFVERGLPDSTLRSWADALWWSLTTLTTVGYGDHVPVTTAGRLIAAVVMVAGVAVIGAVAAIVALAVAHRVAREEERTLEAEAGTLEHRLEVRLDRIEARLRSLDAQLRSSPPSRAGDTSGDAQLEQGSGDGSPASP